MTFIESDALVLKVDSYRASTSLVTMITPVSGVVKAIMSVRSQHRYRAILQPGQLLSIEAQARKSNPQFINVNRFYIKNLFTSDDYQKWVLQNYWAEILIKTSHDPDESPKFFQKSYQVFYEAGDRIKHANLVLGYLFSCLADIGYQIKWHSCFSCHKPTRKKLAGKLLRLKQNYMFDLANHGLLCQNCWSDKRQLPLLGDWFVRFLALSYHERLDDLSYDKQYAAFKISHHILSNYFDLRFNSWLFVDQLYQSQRSEKPPLDTKNINLGDQNCSDIATDKTEK